MAWGRREGRGNGVALLALLVALAALFLAWSAYRRTGGTMGELTQGVRGLDHPLKVGEDSDWKGALDRARARLAERRPDVESQRNLEQVRRDVAEIRESLAHAFRNIGENTGDEAKQKWRGVDADLERLEAELKEGGARAKATLDGLLEKMKR
jgi:hypothetical protein